MTSDSNVSKESKKEETKQTPKEETKEPAIENLVVPDDEKWLIRDCDVYYEEYKECTSFRGRFHQYFIFGESLDCNHWKKDYDNCSKWNSNKDCRAGLAVIKSEKERRLNRLRAHYRNDTWKKREAPPEDWAKPLPEWMVKRDENTYLAEKAKELREGISVETKSSCAIM